MGVGVVASCQVASRKLQAFNTSVIWNGTYKDRVEKNDSYENRNQKRRGK